MFNVICPLFYEYFGFANCYVIYIIQEGGKNVLGFIVGGSSIEARKRCATEVAARNVSGFMNFFFLMQTIFYF